MQKPRSGCPHSVANRHQLSVSDWVLCAFHGVVPAAQYGIGDNDNGPDGNLASGSGATRLCQRDAHPLLVELVCFRRSHGPS